MENDCWKVSLLKLTEKIKFFFLKNSFCNLKANKWYENCIITLSIGSGRLILYELEWLQSRDVLVTHSTLTLLALFSICCFEQLKKKQHKVKKKKIYLLYNYGLMFVCFSFFLPSFFFFLGGGGGGGGGGKNKYKNKLGKRNTHE